MAETTWMPCLARPADMRAAAKDSDARHHRPSARPSFCCTPLSLLQVFQYGWRGGVQHNDRTLAGGQVPPGGLEGASARRAVLLPEEGVLPVGPGR